MEKSEPSLLDRVDWRIQEQTWDKPKHVLGQVSSLCRPQMTSMVPNLLFVVGCDRQGDGRWYRILRPNGKLLLKGWSSSEELEQTVTSKDHHVDWARLSFPNCGFGSVLI